MLPNYGFKYPQKCKMLPNDDKASAAAQGRDGRVAEDGSALQLEIPQLLLRASDLPPALPI